MHVEMEHTDNFKYQHGSPFATEVLKDTHISGKNVF